MNSGNGGGYTHISAKGGKDKKVKATSNFLGKKAFRVPYVQGEKLGRGMGGRDSWKT